MPRETGWIRNVCDGSSEHCVKIAFAKEDDEKSKSNWHEVKYVTKDGELMHYWLCDSCHKEWKDIIASTDKTVNKFIEVRE